MSNELILVVEADAKSRSVLELSLKKASYQVHIVERGREALEWLEDGGQGPALIISGTELPGMSGFEFCSRVKENLDWEPIPFIFLTDAGSMDAKRQGFELGVEDFLTKPIYVKEITTRVQLMLQRREKELLAVAGAEEVSGSLEDVTLIDLLQAIEQHKRSGVADLGRDSRRGVFYFREGRIIDAATGKLRGEEAIYRMMLWATGTYTVRYMSTIKRRDRVNMETQDLLIEGMRNIERWEQAQGDGPGLDRVFEVNYRQLADHLRDLPDEVNAVIRLFDGYRTSQDVIDDSALGAVETLGVISKLQGQGLVHDVTPEKGDDDMLVDVGGATANLNDWLGMEAGETVEPSARPDVRKPAETEAQKVRRRREERKRRKLESRRRTGSYTTMRARNASDRRTARLSTGNESVVAAIAESPVASKVEEAPESPEEAALRAELEAIEVKKQALKSETERLVKEREAREQTRAEEAASAAAPLAKAASPETERLRARLAEAEAEALKLTQERAKLQAEIDRQDAEEAASKAAEEAARVESERLAAEEAARVEAEREAAEEAARQAAEAAALAEAERRATAEAEKLALARQELEAAQQRADEEAARLEALKRERDDLARVETEKQAAADEAERLEAERQAAEKEAARVESERQASEEAARKAAEEAAFKAAEVARVAAERQASEEAARVEAERKAAEEEAARLETERLAAEKEAARKAELELASKSDEGTAPTIVLATKSSVEIEALPPLTAPKDPDKAIDEGKLREGRTERTTSPDIKQAQDSFFDNEPEFYSEPEPAAQSNSSMKIMGAVVVVLALIAAFFLYQNSQKNKGKNTGKTPPTAENKGGTDKAATNTADAGASADTSLAAVENAADTGSAASPEFVIEARDKASEQIWSVAHARSIYHPETSEYLLAPEGEEGEEGEEDPPKQANNNQGGNNRPPVVRNNNPKGDNPKPVKEGPIQVDKDNAIDSMDDAAKKREVQKLLKDAQRLINSGKFAEAIKKLNEAKILAPSSGQINRLLGIANHNSNKSRQALPYLERAVRSNGSDATTVRILGDAYMATGNRSKAIETYKKFLVLRPTGAISDQVRKIVARHR